MWGNGRDPDAAFRELAKPKLVGWLALACLGVWVVLVWRPTMEMTMSVSCGLGLLLLLVLAGTFFGALSLQRSALGRWPSASGALAGAGQGGVFGFVVSERDFVSLGGSAPEPRLGWYVFAVAVFGALGAIVGAFAIGTSGRAAASLERREIDVLPWTLRDTALWAAGAAAIAYERDLHAAALALSFAAVVAFVATLVARRRSDRVVARIAAGELDGFRYDEAGGTILVDTGGGDPYRAGPTWTIAARATRGSSFHLR